MVQGYEDLNDHDRLPHDPIFEIAVGKLSSEEHQRNLLLTLRSHCPNGTEELLMAIASTRNSTDVTKASNL